MKYGMNIRTEGALDFLSLGALNHRVDPGIVPFGKATTWQVHPSGGEYNVAANLANCFRLKCGIASAMVNYPIGNLISERVLMMGLKPFYKYFEHNGVNGPNMATIYSDRLRTNKVDAIMTASQSIALGVFKAMIALDKNIPEDIAIFGYDDLPWMEVVEPKISTTHQPIKEIAIKSCEILFSALKNGDESIQSHCIDTEIIFRRSCGCK